MRVLVCGGRNYFDRTKVFEVLDQLAPTFIIQGGASGADGLAKNWAAARDVPQQQYAADWRTHGPAAGAIRNARMLAAGKPDLVIAFAGGRGTADMVRRARAAGIEVREIAP